MGSLTTLDTIWILIAAFLVFFLILKKTMGIRVKNETEIKGLDIEEHGMEAYAGFQIFIND
jgi:Amt family ammonium transporter